MKLSRFSISSPSFTIGRSIAGLSCLLLQVTLIGRLPATTWAVCAPSQYKTDKKLSGH
jgi:hypothetical protein